MGYNKKYFTVGLFFFLIFASFFVVAVEDASKKKMTWDSFIEEAPDYLAKFFGFVQPEEGDKLIGNVEFEDFNFGRYFYIAFVAGMLLWVYYISVITIHRKITFYKAERRGAHGALRPTMIKGEWIQAIAGRIWKVFLFAFVFAILMQIPILNRVLQIVTFDLAIKDSSGGLFLKAFILAFEVGFLPQIFGTIRRLKIEKTYTARQEKKLASYNQVPEKKS